MLFHPQFFTSHFCQFLSLTSISLSPPKLCSLTCFPFKSFALSHMCRVSPRSSSAHYSSSPSDVAKDEGAPLLNRCGTLTPSSGGMHRKRALALSSAALESNLGLTYNAATSSLIKFFKTWESDWCFLNESDTTQETMQSAVLHWKNGFPESLARTLFIMLGGTDVRFGFRCCQAVLQKMQNLLWLLFSHLHH